MKLARLLLAISATQCVVSRDLGHDLPTEPAGGGGSGASADLSCVGHIELVTQPFTRATGVLRVTNGIGDPTPVTGADVRICGMADVECAQPIYETVSGPDGEALIEMPFDPVDGFVGYFEVGDSEFLNLLHVVPAVREQGRIVYAGVFRRANEVAFYHAANDSEPHPARGTIGLVAGDCSGPAAHLTVDIDEPGEGTRVVYLEGEEPASERTETDSQAVVVILDVPPGHHVVRSRAGDVEIGAAEITVRAGAFTTFHLNPTPPLP